LSSPNALPSLRNLANQPLSQLQALVNDIWDSPAESEEKLRQVNWWLGLAQVASSKALAENVSREAEETLGWTHLVIDIYEHLISRHADESLMLSLMFFKARFIVKYEKVSDEKIGGVNEIVEWSLSDLGVSLEDIQASLPFTAEKLDRTNRSDIRRLRSIKNRLSVLKYLQEHNRLAPDETLNKWLEIRKHLP
jgi:hypothetical protein